VVDFRFSSLAIIAVAALLAMTGCATTTDVADSGTEPAAVTTGKADDPTVAELDRLLVTGAESLELGNHAEALHDYALLTLLSPDSEQGRRAASELGRLSNGIRLEPSSEWLAPDGSQVSASTRELRSAGAPLPSVIATIGEGPARVAVHALTIQFVVTEGDTPGASMLLPTSEFGTATAPIQGEVSGTAPISVAAVPVVRTVRGQVALSSDPLVFVYDPPAAVFVAVTATLVGDRVLPAPELAAVVASGLRQIGSVAVIAASAVDGFLGANAGDPDAIRVILDANDAAILGVAVIDVQDVSQVEYDGKVYNIWKVDAVVRFSLFDPAGGRSLITLTSEPLGGQGGSEADALSDIARVGAQALDSLIGPRVEELRSLVAGSGE